jgi:hypothetical protein
VTTRPIETRLSRIFEVKIPLAADRDQDLGVSLGLAVARAFGLEDVVGDLIDLGAGALQNVGAAVDHRVQQFHQHHFARYARHARARQLVLDQGKRLRLVVAHGDQAVTGQDEGDGRRFRHVGVGLAHQRRGHVAGAVLDIEPAGNLDFLHVFPGRHRDPGQPLDRAVLLHRRVQQVDPDRIVRQSRRIRPGTFFRRIRREQTPKTWATPELGGNLVLTRLLGANRYLLRSKTLEHQRH